MSELPPEYVGPESATLSSKVRSHWEDFQKHYTQNLIGKLLTLIDATVSDPEQRKAQKDLVKQTIYQANRNYFDMCILGSHNFMAKELGEDLMGKEPQNDCFYNNDIPLKYEYSRKKKENK